MRKRPQQSVAFPDGEILLTIVAATSYLLFLLLLINSAATMGGACLYTFWLPYQTQYFSPYWLSLSLVSGLVVLALIGLVVSIRGGRRQLWSIVYYATAIFVLGWWLYDMVGFWNAMQYERGLLTINEYYDQVPIPQWIEPHQCRGI